MGKIFDASQKAGGMEIKMNRHRYVSKSLFGYEITADATVLDEGIQVILYGGAKSHIGSVTIVGFDGHVNTTVFDGHKEAGLSQKWALTIAHNKGLPAIVSAGIHYDNATREQIQEILKTCDELLEQLLDCLII